MTQYTNNLAEPKSFPLEGELRGAGDLGSFFSQQLASWDLPARNYAALQQVQKKELDVNGMTFKVQFNPSRIVSSAAKVDAKSIQERKCFLCRENLPKEQQGISFGDNYLILVNPFPIFPTHLTIPDNRHVDQRIAGRIGDMLDLAKQLTDFVIFYNGPKCGASAPDHAHFQAGNRGFLPLEVDFETYVTKQNLLVNQPDIAVYALDFPVAFVLESSNRGIVTNWFEKIQAPLNPPGGGKESEEPMMNLLCWYGGGKWRLVVFPRKLHRPWQFSAEGSDNLLISPAAVDLGGVFITPLEKDFQKIRSEDIADILEQISIGKEEFEHLSLILSKGEGKSCERE